MKKSLVCIVILMLLLSACSPAPADQPTTTTTPSESQQTNPTLPSETQGSNTESTESQPVTDPSKSVDAWQVDKPAYLTYETYFATPRDISTAAKSWIKGNHKFTVTQSGNTWAVFCQETNQFYKIPNASAYKEYNLLGADGRYGYLYFEGTLIRMDLATGEPEQLLHYPIYKSASFILCDNLVLYYSVYVDDTLEIGRIYLPELKYDSLYKAQGEFYNIALQPISNTKEPLSWTMMNPDFVELLKTELANPNSQYQLISFNGPDGSVEYDYTRYWKDHVDLSQVLMEPSMLHHIQDVSGIRALLKCTFDPVNGSLTKKTGIIDNCFHGSGMPHDHYNPEITTAPEPEVIMSQWANLQNPMPDIVTTKETEADMLRLPDVDSGQYLYAKTDGDYQKLVDSPVSWSVGTGNGAIYISADKRSVFAVSYQDRQPIEIYRSTEGNITAPDRFGANMDLERQWLVIRDGDTLVQIDLAAGKSRQLVRHQDIRPYYYIDGGETTVYFEICAGLHGTGYTIDMETGELSEHYRL